MSGPKDSYGERERCPVHGRGRRLSQENLREIRREIDIQNSLPKLRCLAVAAIVFMQTSNERALRAFG